MSWLDEIDEEEDTTKESTSNQSSQSEPSWQNKLTPELEEQIDDAFPYPSYRDHQYETIAEAAVALFEEDYQNVVINGPTGVGKSGINVTLAQMADDAFMTTPQKKLLRQLRDDDDLNEFYNVLMGRAEYSCRPYDPDEKERVENKCNDCFVTRTSDTSCQEELCWYWGAKEDAMFNDIAVLTFAFLIYDGMIPVFAAEGQERISFFDRDMLIVDECHNLESQAAEMFAGFKLSPRTLPGEVYSELPNHLDFDAVKFEEVKPAADDVYEAACEFIYENNVDEIPDSQRELKEEVDEAVEKCEKFRRKYKNCKRSFRNGDDWVVDVDTDHQNNLTVKIMPVDVSDFLQHRVWDRAEKRVLSTATLPHQSYPSKWLKKVGIDPQNTKVIQKPMPFPAENRQIDTRHVVGSMSSGGMEEHWDDVVNALKRISARHEGEKGLVHTVSYDRAEELKKEFPSNATLHDWSRDEEVVMKSWQSSDRDILFTPAMMDGVDLPDDKCRWQALVKVPYPSIGSSRINFKLNERNQWGDYYDSAATSIIQSVGRGVRHKEDECTYYVLDEAFFDVNARASFPDWFREAIVT